MTKKVPARPLSSPVPESGTAVMDNLGTPRFMMALCCKMNEPAFPRERAGYVLHRDRGRGTFQLEKDLERA